MTVRSTWLLVAILVVAAALRLAAIGERSLWLDEATSLQVSSEPAAKIAAGEAFDNHTPPLYYLLLHLWWWIAPKTEVGLRLPSVAFDLVTIALAWVVFGRQLGRRAGAAAAAILAVSEYAVYYGQEGRMYALVCCLGLASYGLALRIRDRRDTAGTWLLLVGVAVAGMYTHYFYALLLAALTAAVTVELRSDPRRLLGWWGAMAAVGIAFAPWLGVVAALAGQGGQPFRRFTFLVLPYTVFRWVAGYAVFPLNYGSKDDWAASLAAHLPAVVGYLVVFGVLLLVGLRRLWVAHRRESVVLLVPLVVPALAALLLSLSSPMLSERYLIVSLPQLAALLALALTGPAGGPLLRVVRAAGVVLVMWGLALHYLSPQFGNTQWREAVQLVRERAGSARQIYVYPDHARAVVAFYAEPDLAVRPVTEGVLAELLATPADPAADPRPQRLWLVERGHVPTISDRLRRAGYAIDVETLLPLRNGVRVFHMVRAPAAADGR